jgi:hypothetical protein
MAGRRGGRRGAEEVSRRHGKTGSDGFATRPTARPDLFAGDEECQLSLWTPFDLRRSYQPEITSWPVAGHSLCSAGAGYVASALSTAQFSTHIRYNRNSMVVSVKTPN